MGIGANTGEPAEYIEYAVAIPERATAKRIEIERYKTLDTDIRIREARNLKRRQLRAIKKTSNPRLLKQLLQTGMSIPEARDYIKQNK